jgi:hypothetical protein
LKGIMRIFKDKINFSRYVWSLMEVLRQLVFKWERSLTTEKYLLVEKNDVRKLKLANLWFFQFYREEGRPLICTDETYFHSTIKSRAQTDNEEAGLKTPVSKGQRVIVVHAGGKDSDREMSAVDTLDS